MDHEGCNLRLQLVMAPRHRKMLEELARHHQRSMSSIIRLAIERIYQIELLRGTRAAGSAIVKPRS